MIKISKEFDDRFVTIFNNRHEILVIDSDPKYGGLYLWIFHRKLHEDLDDGRRLKIIGVDFV